MPMQAPSDLSREAEALAKAEAALRIEQPSQTKATKMFDDVRELDEILAGIKWERVEDDMEALREMCYSCSRNRADEQAEVLERALTLYENLLDFGEAAGHIVV